MLTYPLKLLGANLRRHVSVIRLRSGKLVIHSTGPFTRDDITAIRRCGEPGWLVEAMLRHDTFAREGRAAFPGIPYLAPPGFEKRVPFAVAPIFPMPSDWRGELEALEVDGVPSMRETVFFHPASRTLIVADLVFNFGDANPAWTRLLMRFAVGARRNPGFSRAVKFAIKDKVAFSRSIDAILAWDFDRVIVGHGEPIETGGKEKVTALFRDAGY